MIHLPSEPGSELSSERSRSPRTPAIRPGSAGTDTLATEGQLRAVN